MTDAKAQKCECDPCQVCLRSSEACGLSKCPLRGEQPCPTCTGLTPPGMGEADAKEQKCETCDDKGFVRDDDNGGLCLDCDWRRNGYRVQRAYLRVEAERDAARAEIAALRVELAAAEKDAGRYKIAREFVQPRYLSNCLGIEWVDIKKGQSIVEKIDELCDAAMQQGSTKEAT